MRKLQFLILRGLALATVFCLGCDSGVLQGGGGSRETYDVGWIQCADEGGYCAFSGAQEVRYGANGKFVIKTLTDGTPCTNQVFGDPIYGTRKSCSLRDPGSASGGLEPGLTAEFFDFTAELTALPDLSGSTATVSRVDANINYASTRAAWSGLPASMADTFASRHTGFLRVASAGAYSFYLNSDDGSRLWIDGDLVVDNEGLHGMREVSAQVTLAAGDHALRVEFFENWGDAGLILSWSGPGIAKQVVPASALFHAGTGSPPPPTTCPGNCNNHGTCSSGACTCSTGFAGSACDTCAAGYSGYPNCAGVVNPPTCPGNCNNHGTCSSGGCNCNQGFAGSACDACAAGFSGYPNCTAVVAPPSSCVQAVIDDMTLACDGKLHGAEGMSWQTCGADPGYGGVPVPAQNYKGQWWQAMTAWGQAYIPVEGSSATNCRLQLRNLVTKFLLKDGKWHTMNTCNPGGCAYFENFANNACIGAGERDESGNGGGISVMVGVGAWAGHNYHWYSNRRESVDVNNIVGVFASVEGRLIVDDPGKPNDCGQCKNLVTMGADWWLNTSTGWLPDWSANSGIGGGRNKWATTQWQTFNFTSQSPAQTKANPPCP